MRTNPAQLLSDAGAAGGLSFVGEQHYRDAVAEFDRLWDACAAKKCPERMEQLLQVIQGFEERLSAERKPARQDERSASEP